MSKKHYDNKTDILRQMKENRIRADIAAVIACMRMRYDDQLLD